MSRLLRWALRLLLGGAALMVLAGAAGWVLLSGALPDYSERVVAAGLDHPVTVIRDANAVPHIRAESARDAWFALGLVHAQDRLWQMELGRRAAQGRLAALFGPRAVALDRLAKTLDIHGYARRAVAHQSAEASRALDAYAAGVNAWIAEVNAEAKGRGAPEFFLFEGALSPWTPADSIAILKMMALRLSGAAREEVRRARFQLALPPERVGDILPGSPGQATLTVPRFSALFPGATFPATTIAPDPLMQALGPPAPGLAGASNAWAVDATRSASARPLLANDPHLWLSAPTIWYLADLQGGGLSAIGGTLPGTPLVLIGHNGRVGWGLTTANIDDQDIFIEKLNPADPGQYLTPDGWAAFEERRLRIEVADAPDEILSVRRSRHGPVLAPGQFGAETVTPEGHVAALAWTALTDEDRSLSAGIALMRARSRAEAMAALADVTAPGQMVTLADAEGIAMAMAGAMPARNAASGARGRIPAPGWLAVNDWQGLRPPSAAPRSLDPPEGALAHANNRISDAPFPDHVGNDWAPPYRIRRIRQELAARRFHSRDSFTALQTDTVSEMARTVLPLIARDLWWREGAAPADARMAEALALLADWNGDMDRYRPEPLIFMEWMRWLTRWLARDEIGGLFETVAGPQPLFVERVFRDVEGAGIWCDIAMTPERESCADMARRALTDALARLARDHGARLSAWRWGEAHVARHPHQPLGHGTGIAALVSIEHETSGGPFTLMRGAVPGDGAQPFRNIHAAGLRIVMDFADLDRSVGIIATGQSGHPLSRWYDHLAEPWSRGDYIPLSQNTGDALSGSVGRMRLMPDDRQ